MSSTFWSNTQRRSINSSSGWRCSRRQPARYRLSAGGSRTGSTEGPCAGTSVFGCPGRGFWLLPKPWGGRTGFRSGWQKLPPPPQRIKRVAVLALAERGPERLLRSQVTASDVTCKKRFSCWCAWFGEQKAFWLKGTFTITQPACQNTSYYVIWCTVQPFESTIVSLKKFWTQ